MWPRPSARCAIAQRSSDATRPRRKRSFVYSPLLPSRPIYNGLERDRCKLARLAGLEPATLGLEGRCSIHMSYRRFVLFGSGDSERQISNYHLSRSVNAGATQDRFANEVSSAHPYGAPSASNLPLEDCRTCYPRLRRPMLYPYELQALRALRIRRQRTADF